MLLFQSTAISRHRTLNRHSSSTPKHDWPHILRNFDFNRPSETNFASNVYIPIFQPKYSYSQTLFPLSSKCLNHFLTFRSSFWRRMYHTHKLLIFTPSKLICAQIFFVHLISLTSSIFSSCFILPALCYIAHFFLNTSSSHPNSKFHYKFNF